MNNQNIRFYMKIRLPDGSYTDGKIDYNNHPKLLGLSKLSWNKLRILDVAANDGFWSFWSEQAGAQEVLAIDVDSFESYDWGYDGCPPELIPQLGSGTHPSQWTDAGAGFWYLHRVLNSKVKKECLSTYELNNKKHGVFDVIFHYGLLYHLRHPLLALDILRKVCSGALVIETHMVNFLGNLPASLFYWDDVLNTYTNWTGPSEGSIVAWLKSAGFPHIFSKVMNPNSAYTRGVFIACINDDWRDNFKDNQNLFYYDENYIKNLHNNTKNLLENKNSQWFNSAQVAEIYFQQGKELLELKQEQRAAECFKKAAQTDYSRAVLFLIWQARACKAYNNINQARTLLNNAYQLHPSTVTELHMMANTYVAINSIERAIEMYEKAIKLEPSNELLKSNFARVRGMAKSLNH